MGAPQRVLGADRSMWSTEFSRDGTLIVGGAQDGTVLLWPGVRAADRPAWTGRGVGR